MENMCGIRRTAPIVFTVFIGPLWGKFIYDGDSACSENIACYGCLVVAVHFEGRDKKVVNPDVCTGDDTFVYTPLLSYVFFI